MRLSIMLGLLLTVYNLIFAGGAVIKRHKSDSSAALQHGVGRNNEHFFDKHDNDDESDDFSPYFAAFSDRLRRELDVHEKLRDQLKHFHSLDWDEIAEVKAFESEDSDDWGGRVSSVQENSHK